MKTGQTGLIQTEICQRVWIKLTRPCFYQTRSAWSADQRSNKNHSPAYNFAPTVTKFCVMWEGQTLPHHTKFGNCRYKILDSRAFLSWSLIHGLRWSGLIKAEPASKHKHNKTQQCLNGMDNSWYRKVSNIRRTKFQNFSDSRPTLPLSSHNLLKPCIKSIMKMYLEQCRQAMLQLHLSDRQFNCQLRCVLY